MTVWTQRPEGVKDYPRIWDMEGLQINENLEGKFVLLDANQPYGIPMSPVIAIFENLDAAKAQAESTGPMDWSEVEE